ncbi:MBL fold metallo-hydrolase [Candidatus Azambacteria bacterium]|nr:MBL fold metallo-hydrolase [Candidatus Azambacteria bacterium]
MIKIKFCGGVAGSVTGACYLIETKSTKVIVDCGMFQGSKFSEFSNSDPFAFNPSEVEAMILTHAHIDHCGRVPKLVRDGFKGKIYGTSPTLDFAHTLLNDSEHVIKEEARREGLQPFYTIKDVEKAFEMAAPKNYDEEVVVSSDVRFFLRNAGHILGSSIIELFVKNGSDKEIKIVFSGDLGNYPAPVIGETRFIDDADYILIESAYGDRFHEDNKKRKDLLEDVIEETVNKGGTLMIPAFATERTQELLYEMNELVEHGRIARMPIFLDSPLAIKITDIYKRHEDYFDKKTQHLIASGDDVFNFPGLKFTPSVEESKAIGRHEGPKIIIAGSGMSNGGRIIYHEAKYLSDPRNTLLIIGFQVKGSLGRKLLDGEKEVRILGQNIQVKAKVVHIGGYSAHADQKQIIEWLSPMRHTAKKVFVVQGEHTAAEALIQRIKDELAMDAQMPDMNQEVFLEEK